MIFKNGDEIVHIEIQNNNHPQMHLRMNRKLENEVEKGTNMLTVDIEKTPFYRIGEKRGIQKGIQEGIEEGLKMCMNKVVYRGQNYIYK